MFFARPGKTDKRPAGDDDDDDDFGGAPTSVFSALNTMQADHINSAVAEVRQSGGKSVKNTNSGLSNWDQVSYGLENRIAANGAFPLTLLAFVTSFFLAIFGVLWYRLSSDTAELVFGQDSVADGVFMAVQLITSASFNDIPDENNLRLLYFVQIFFGLVVFAILVGFITDAVSQFMNSLASGRTKVAADGHTLILGWNEATLRAVVQCSFLRRQYQMLNEGKFLGILFYFQSLIPAFKWCGLLERPSTSLAVSDIVIMDNSITKEEMHIRLAQTLAERGILPWRTKLGRNIICRVGNPTNVNDLIRVGAHRAAAILVMITEQDTKEEDESNGRIFNGATLRTTLALRQVLFTNPYDEARGVTVFPGLRIILQMLHPSEYVDAACFVHPDGKDVVIPMDLSLFLNTLMFKCAAQPGLSSILMSILDFEGSAIRRRKASNLRSGPKNAYGDCIGKTFGLLRREFSRAIFIGIIRPSMPKAFIKRRGFGLCPDPHIVIEPDDLLIFIGPKSNPVHSHEMLDTFNEYIKEAEEIRDANPDIEKHHMSSWKESSKIKSNVLVCGWREVWNAHPERLHARIEEVVRMRKAGSTITFVNGVTQELFKHHMLDKNLIHEETVQDGSNAVSIYGYAKVHKHEGVRLRHITGDAASAPVLSPVINATTIHTAIVLGTQTSVRLGAHHRDTRILNILLLLRKLWSIKREGIPMHIVGENNEDMTARLALAPKRIGKIRTEPDFVNSQAVSARALVQTLAYPLIQPAIQDLFQESKNSAEIVTVAANEYLPLNTPLIYGVIRALVLQTRGERSIAIGIMWRAGHSELLPPHDKTVTLQQGDRLVLLRRMLSSDIQNRVEAATILARKWKERAMRRAAQKWQVPNGGSQEPASTGDPVVNQGPSSQRMF